MKRILKCRVMLEGNVLNIMTLFIYSSSHACHLLFQNAYMLGSYFLNVYILNILMEDNCVMILYV